MEIKQKIKRKDLNSAGKNLISPGKSTILKTDDQNKHPLLIKMKTKSKERDNNQ